MANGKLPEIEEIIPTMRAWRCLKRAEISDTEDLVEMSRAALLTIPGLGVKTADLIERSLKSRGLSLRSS